MGVSVGYEPQLHVPLPLTLSLCAAGKQAWQCPGRSPRPHLHLMYSGLPASLGLPLAPAQSNLPDREVVRGQPRKVGGGGTQAGVEAGRGQRTLGWGTH